MGEAAAVGLSRAHNSPARLLQAFIYVYYADAMQNDDDDAATMTRRVASRPDRFSYAKWCGHFFAQRTPGGRPSRGSFDRVISVKITSLSLSLSLSLPLFPSISFSSFFFFVSAARFSPWRKLQLHEERERNILAVKFYATTGAVKYTILRSISWWYGPGNAVPLISVFPRLKFEKFREIGNAVPVANLSPCAETRR